MPLLQLSFVERAAAPTHESPTQNLIATRTQTTITSPHTPPSMSFSVTNFTMELKTYHMEDTQIEI
jgi:hypothetical protein